MSNASCLILAGALAAFVAGGCGDPSPASLTCVQLADQLGARIAATSRACTAPSDCVVVGNAIDKTGTPTCGEGLAFASNCSGAGVNRQAWEADPTTAALGAEWFERCTPLGSASGVAGIYDCGRGDVACVDQLCSVAPYDCFRSGDAGVE